jgi:DNA-directed RNA polymerase subunit RPC12/RpoP
MPKRGQSADEGLIYSHPTMCLHCHVVVEMVHEAGADPRTGAWECPKCGHKYLFAHWKIKRKKPKAA